MRMMVPTPVGELHRQSRVARKLGSPFVAAVLEAGHRQLYLAPRTAELIAGWPRDPSASALAMRFNAALHALARRGEPEALRALYRREHDDYDGAIGAALAASDSFIARWMEDTPQTNEVGRAAAIGAALMVARRRFGLPFELLELGSSCGLNLNLAHYGYDLGGISAGQVDSPVQVVPLWTGPEPLPAPIEVASARGVDLNPLDPGDAETRERLLSYVWADQPGRARRLERALDLALRHPPRIDRQDAASWLVERLAEPQLAGRCRVVFHSMVLQYFTGEDRATVLNAIHGAGARATAERPLAWIGFEWTPTRSEVQLTLTCWPSGETRRLATCHAYGNWIDWLG
ncbi:hypothetical protein HNP52_001863 [Sphingomonas kyeonggiensis]|uniref:DUF2332 domain-containing protein n=1 Tax=Sphingomonas kyeonggiensis TaxID=1268553 RepID=A0A7W7K0P3_9SPHN|nr:DUF2332 family protein [Sphingomonas kyeonggiensis]MBB4838794.1 hypothetical protein [Sphingomonas kyeonggiensis]